MFFAGSQYFPAAHRGYQATSLPSSLPDCASMTTARTESVPKSIPMISVSFAIWLVSLLCTASWLYTSQPRYFAECFLDHRGRRARG